MDAFAPLAALMIGGFGAAIFLLFRLESRLDKRADRLERDLAEVAAQVAAIASAITATRAA